MFDRINPKTIACPACNPGNRSKAERDIVKMLKDRVPNISISIGDRTILPSRLELDIVLPAHKVAIEFDGLYWHGELCGKDRKYHISKTNEAESVGYRLFHIFEDEWNTKPNLIIDRILSAINQQPLKRVYARKCTVEIISSKETKLFMNEYHLQGHGPTKWSVGLRSPDGELLQVMTLSKPNASHGAVKNSTGVYELNRLCTRHGVSVIGGASKLLSYVKTQFTEIRRIVSYADRRYSVVGNNVYEQLGFTLTKFVPPTYWYVQRGTAIKHHRFNFTKRRTVELGGNPLSTEWENMQMLGYDRIWDCGRLRYEMDIT
jgi:very-short-patch-repair endonuclease